MAASFRPIKFAVLIPSRGRWDILAKTLQRQPFLNDVATYIGVENDEYREYMRVLTNMALPKHQRVTCRIITYNNKEGSVGHAREELRLAATRDKYEWYVITDDNAKFTAESLNALVQSAEAWRIHTGKLTFMAGMHSTAMHFDRNLIQKKHTVDGWTTYPGFGFIFHAVPHMWYGQKYSYPRDCFALEDRHMMLAAIAAGHSEFRVSMDAPFSKNRYQLGGQGDISKRRWNCGRAIERLAHDFPREVGSRGTMPLPWQFIMKLRDGAVVDRLIGGAMRKGDKLERPVMRAKVRRQK